MSFIEALGRAKVQPVVAHHRFLLAYSPHNKLIHAFFEGKRDESFYGSAIRRFVPPDWALKTYQCNNKDGVYYAFENLHARSKREQPLLFFVDKDIDDIVPYTYREHELIYITEFYSVENYIVTSQCVEVIWAELFKQSAGTDAASELLKEFETALKEIHEVLLDMMSWVLFHRRNQSNPNLDCIQTDRLFSVGNDLTLTRASNKQEMFDMLDQQAHVATQAQDLPQIEQCRRELESFEPKAVIRGHNEMDFFIAFFNKVREVAAVEGIKTSTPITKANVIDILGPRVPLSAKLNAFLAKHLDFNPKLDFAG